MYSLQDCFILDTGSSSGIFVWIGKHATKQEKVQAMKSAEEFLAKSGLPKWTKICENDFRAPESQHIHQDHNKDA